MPASVQLRADVLQPQLGRSDGALQGAADSDGPAEGRSDTGCWGSGPPGVRPQEGGVEHELEQAGQEDLS